jgi:hypothetical protein
VIALRKKFNLDSQELDGYSVLVHGGRGAGKTHLMGDFLKTESKYGLVKFINVMGEDGCLTLRGMGLGDIGEDVDSLKDFLDVLAECTKDKVHAIAVDSAHALSRWIMRKVTGSDRLPEIKTSGPNEWGAYHQDSYNTYMTLRRAAKMIMVSCPSDKSVEQLSGKTFVTPDLPGKQAAGIAGNFDFVGYLEVINSTGEVTRTFNMTPNNTIIVRQRLPKQIKEAIKLPDGPGSWAVIKGRIEESWK